MESSVSIEKYNIFEREERRGLEIGYNFGTSQ